VLLFKDVQLWLTNLSQNQKEKEVLTITVVVEIHAVVMVVETAVVEKTVVVETERRIYNTFYNYKKKGTI
jgi:hypothetical protein